MEEVTNCKKLRKMEKKMSIMSMVCQDYPRYIENNLVLQSIIILKLRVEVEQVAVHMNMMMKMTKKLKGHLQTTSTIAHKVKLS